MHDTIRQSLRKRKHYHWPTKKFQLITFFRLPLKSKTKYETKQTSDDEFTSLINNHVTFL